MELDKRGIDLDLVFCPCCNNSVETCAHCLVTCDLTMSMCVKIFNWWKVGIVNVFIIEELHAYSFNIPTSLASVW